MKKTNEEVLEFLGTANCWLQENKEESKFRYAVAKVAKKAERARARVQEEVDDLNVEHALEVEDEKTKQKRLLKNEREQYEYDKSGMNARNKAVRLLMQQEVEIDPHFSDAPTDLKSEFRIVFEGFVIKEGTNGSSDLNAPA